METADYPADPGPIYFCYPLGERVELGLSLDYAAVRRIAGSRTPIAFAPVAVTLLELLLLR
jgi:hypothetical protein